LSISSAEPFGGLQGAGEMHEDRIMLSELMEYTLGIYSPK